MADSRWETVDALKERSTNLHTAALRASSLKKKEYLRAKADAVWAEAVKIEVQLRENVCSKCGKQK